MPVSKADEVIPIAEVVENFINSLHQSGASSEQILEGVVRAFNSKDGILVTSNLDDNADMQELAYKVESDLVKTRIDLANYSRQEISG